MPRKIRIEYPGAIYQIMSWGNRRKDIFHDEIDRHDFLKKGKRVKPENAAP
jgi:hypothetical protein